MPYLEVSELTAAARLETGLEDLGSDSWSEGLERLVDSAVTQSQASETGIEVIRADLISHLTTRLRLTEWRRLHPEVAEVDVVAPVVIIGQARTGTTILYDVLNQDPGLRAPLTWEVDEPVPPPEPGTRDTDPRVAASDERLAATELLIPGFRAMHPMGARLAQECVRITGGDFRSIIFATQWRVPSYTNWLLGEADLAPAYRYHHAFLQHLASRYPTDRWLLKTPGHLWHLDALLAEYPDALLIQTHRDPLTTIASVSSLVSVLRLLVQTEPDIADIATEWAEYLVEGFDRSVRARESGIVNPDRVVDVAFDDFMADPLATIHRIYRSLDLELTAQAESKMRAFLRATPREKHGRHDYSFADTGLDAREMRDRTSRYAEFFDVATGTTEMST